MKSSFQPMEVFQKDGSAPAKTKNTFQQLDLIKSEFPFRFIPFGCGSKSKS